MKVCVCDNTEVVTKCDRCNNHLCRRCTALVIGKKDKIEVIHKVCLKKKERLE